MNKDQIILFKEMIKESIRSVVKEELIGIIKELDSMKKSHEKDLKEVKLLVGGVLKESKKITTTTSSGGTSTGAVKTREKMQPITEKTQSRLAAVFQRANELSGTGVTNNNPVPVNTPKVAAPIQNILLETANDMSDEDEVNFGEGEMTDEPGWTEPPMEDYEDIEEPGNYSSRLPDFPVR